jgi:acyl carrier protein
MEESSIYAKLTRIFRDVLDDENIELSPGVTAKDVDGWDSLTHIRLLMEIERAFHIKFSTSEIGRLENVGSLVALIGSRT